MGRRGPALTEGGKSGGIAALRSQVNPLLFASLYAENRYDVAPILRCWLRRGDNVLLDRYVEANFGHQARATPLKQRR